MQLTLTLTTLLFTSLTTLTTALPAKSTTTQVRDTCTSIQPPQSLTPRLNLLNRPDLSLTTTQTILFTLPSPSFTLPGPCTLRARFPPHWEVIDTSVQSGGSPLPVNVYAVDGPAAGALVGSVRFASPNSEENGGGWEGPGERVVVVNSFVCRERMEFRFELGGVGEVGFVNGFDAGLGVSGGVEVVYGC